MLSFISAHLMFKKFSKSPKRQSSPYPTLESSGIANAENVSVVTASVSRLPITEDSLSLLKLDLLKSKSISKDNQGTNLEISNSDNILNVNMAVDYIQLCKIPDCIKDLPAFDGNPLQLYDFINNVELILTQVAGVDGTPQAQMWLRAIRNKITGDASNVLNMYGTGLDWKDIKKALISRYSDKRNETSLIIELNAKRQSSSTVEQFFASITQIFSTMTNYVRLHETDEVQITSKIKLYANLCKDVFLIGLNEPLGLAIRSREPKSLEDAFDLCIKEQNILFARNATIKTSFGEKPKNAPPINPLQFKGPSIYPPQMYNYPSPPMFMPVASQPHPQFNSRPFQQNTFQPQNINPGYRYQSNQIHPQQQFSLFNRPQFNFNHNQSTLRPLNPNFQKPKLYNPTPMDLGSNRYSNQSKPVLSKQEMHTKENKQEQEQNTLPDLTTDQIKTIQDGQVFDNLDQYINPCQYYEPETENYQQHEIDDENFRFGYQNPWGT